MESKLRDAELQVRDAETKLNDVTAKLGDIDGKYSDAQTFVALLEKQVNDLTTEKSRLLDRIDTLEEGNERFFEMKQNQVQALNKGVTAGTACHPHPPLECVRPNIIMECIIV